jgi:nucleotide-binding universal stress UspA family protein
MGSTSLAAAARSTCPLVLVRSDETAGDDCLPPGVTQHGAPVPRVVVLGFDTHHPDDTLLHFALQSASRTGAPRQVLHAWHLPLLWHAHPAHVGHREQAQLQEQEARQLQDTLRGWDQKYPDVRIHADARHGAPAEALIQAAALAALLIVGRRATRPPAGLRLGPVAHAAIHHAACPVAVVRHP